MGSITPEKQCVAHFENMSDSDRTERMEISELEAQKQQDHINGGNYQRAAPPVDEALRKERARITYATSPIFNHH